MALRVFLFFFLLAVVLIGGASLLGAVIGPRSHSDCYIVTLFLGGC